MPDARPTAIITGASAGIGAEFARQLAARGCDLVLVARRHERLAALAAELRDRHGVAAEAFVADLSQPEAVERVAQRIANTPAVDYLVNNAGFGTTAYFDRVEVEKSLAMLAVHNRATVRLTHAALPVMRARGRGFIVNVSSIAAFNPMQGNAVYSATKAFLNNFSLSLQAELRGTGVRVQALCPGFTLTEFHDTAEYRQFSRSQIPGFVWLTAEAVVRASLKALPRGPVVVVPGALYQFAALFMRYVPVAPLFLEWMRRRRRRPAYGD